MNWALIGIMVGIIVGINLEYTIPLEYIKYSAVTIIGILDAIFGGIKAEVTHDDEYNSTLFVTGLIFNIFLALAITLLGEKLGLDLYLAATVVFTFRIFSNLGITRRILITEWSKNSKNKKRKN